MQTQGSRVTYKTLGTGAIIRCDGVVACPPVQAWIGPAVVPINLAINSGVAVDAVAGIRILRAAKRSLD